MPENCFHPSIEGAQHGAKTLAQFLDYAKKSGASGAQPSNYMLQGDKGFKSAKEIKDTFSKAKMKLDGVSAHCPFWVHTSAWTGTPSIRPFIPADVAKKSADEIEKWAEDYLLRLLDLCAELGVKIVPMFWGVAFGWELATGYPWGFWEGESWETRFLKVAPRVYACHVKNFVIRPNVPLRKMEGNWQKRAMQFVDIPSGDLNMTRYVELLVHTGYPQRYCQIID